MPYTVNLDECISCGACEPECSNDAISEVEDGYQIDASKCDECGDCSSVCPVDCIVLA